MCAYGPSGEVGRGIGQSRREKRTVRAVFKIPIQRAGAAPKLIKRNRNVSVAKRAGLEFKKIANAPIIGAH